jgi:ribonuclease-3
MGQPSLETLERALGHRFGQQHLLVQALTHSSLAHEQHLTGEAPAELHQDNEQLEFLGDAVIGLLVGESLFRRFPQLQEGELTRLRAALVSRKHLGHVGAKLRLGR